MTSSDTAANGNTIFVETTARLHFGLLDLRGDLGRKFGGIGAAAPAPTLLVSAAPGDSLEITGQDAERATRFARRFLVYHDLGHLGGRLCVHRALPSHAGLGSGTQLALAVARALAELHGLSSDPADLARAVGRAQRSAVGTWTFAGGGLVIEGGRRDANHAVAPLLVRMPFPPAWRCVVAVPDAAPAISGAAEAAAFAQLAPPSERDVARVAHLVLLALLPALAEDDLPAFGRALTEIQAITGRWFAEVQGGTFTPGPSQELVRRMTELGATGVGQSSWGPAVYGLVEGDDAVRGIADRVRGTLDALAVEGCVYYGPFRSEGARVWKTQASDDVVPLRISSRSS